MSFEVLLTDLQAMQAAREGQVDLIKSMAAGAAMDDSKIKQAATEAGATLPAAADDEAAQAPKVADPDNGSGSEGDETLDDLDFPQDQEGEEDDLAKSFMYDEEGETVEVLDATKVLKSMQARMVRSEEQTSKALSAAVGLIKSQDQALAMQTQLLGQQGQMLKSMQAQLKAFGSQGRGRAAVLSMADQSAGASVETQLMKSHAPLQGLTANEFMNKALAAQTAGRLSSRDVSIAEGYLQRGMQVPAEIVNRVFA